MFAHASPGPAHGADGVSLVNHQHGLMAVLDFDQTFQRTKIAIHAEQTLGGDQYPFVFVTVLGEEAVEGLPIVVRKDMARRARESCALHNAVVRQPIMGDQIARPGQG